MTSAHGCRSVAEVAIQFDESVDNLSKSLSNIREGGTLDDGGGGLGQKREVGRLYSSVCSAVMSSSFMGFGGRASTYSDGY